MTICKGAKRESFSNYRLPTLREASVFFFLTVGGLLSEAGSSRGQPDPRRTIGPTSVHSRFLVKIESVDTPPPCESEIACVVVRRALGCDKDVR
jgi:hypothetical protein